MADENKPAFYPRVGNIRRKDFKPAQPMPFIDDERAMELPQYVDSINGLGKIDLSVPNKQNRELNKRITERDADLMRQVQADRSPLEKLAGGVQAGRFLGSAMTQGINSIPTRIFKGDEAADKFMEERIYKPEQPLAYEYAQDVGDFLEKLETEYKIPPLMPEALPLQFLSGPATAQAARAAGRGAEQVGRKIESAMEPVVKGAFERGGLPREMVMAMGANTQSNVVKPYGGNWLGGADQLSIPENDLRRLKVDTMMGAEGDTVDDVINKKNAINKWIDSNLKNYVKKEMATRDDPVRKLAEEGIIHTPLRDDLDRAGYLENTRKAEGYPAEGMGKSELARRWENLSDDAIRVTKAGAIQDQANTGAKLEKARAELDAHKKQIDEDFIAYLQRLGGLDIKDREVFDKMPNFQKAEILGDTKYKELQGNINTLLARESGFEKRAGELNPFVAKLNPETRLYSGSTYNLGFDHVVDVLREDLAAGRIRPEQLNKVSMEQAVRRTAEYDQDMAKKMRETALERQEGFPVHKEYPEGYKWIELTKPKHEVLEENLPAGYTLRKSDAPYEHQRWQVVDEQGLPAAEYVQANFNYSVPDPKLKALENFFDKKSNKQLKEALDYEGKAMGHCVGSYCDEVSEGNKKIYTLRDAKGEPHVTVEVVPSDDAQAFYEANKKWLDNPVYRRELDLMQDPDLDIPLSEQYVTAARKLLTEAGVKYNEPTPLPPVIKQIKGKQNKAPKDEYLPYVQDFVRSGSWTDVRDLKNTGLKTIDEAFPNYEDAKYFANTNPNAKYVTQAEIDAQRKQINEELINEFGSHRIKPDPQSKTTYGRTDFMTAKELAELEFPGDLERQANMIRGAMQGTTEPGAFSGTIYPPLAEKSGGAIHMQVGGLSKLAKILKKDAPNIIIPSDISRVKEAVRQSKGDFGARRVERAADEIPNLEKLYKEEALKQAFTGDNAKALMTMNPKDFEKYATPIPKSADEPMQYRGYGSQYLNDKMKGMSLSEYIDNLAGVKGGFADVPFLLINKEEQGLPLVPFISGHEGRHRNRAMAKKGVEQGLVELLPRSELREPFTRRSQEEYIEALKKELEMTNNMVEPQIYQQSGTDSFLDNLNKTDSKVRRPAIKLPDIYAKGGRAMAPGGLIKNLLKMTPKEEALSKLPQMKKEVAANQAIEAEYRKAMRDIPYDQQITLKEWESTRIPSASDAYEVTKPNVPKAKGGLTKRKKQYA